MKKLLSLSVLALAVLVAATLAFGQTPACTLAICNVTTCTQNAFINGLPSAGNTNSTVTVNWPACSGASAVSWTGSSGLSYTLNAANTQVNVIGAGTTATGGGDQTVILIHTGDGTLFNFTTGATSTGFRFSGISVEQDASSVFSNGLFGIGGSSHNVRVDHTHFLENAASENSIWLIIYGQVLGVYDHNICDFIIGSVTNGVRVEADTLNGDTQGLGDGSWSLATGFGSFNFFFIETNIFTGGAADDCNHGGRIVFRHNIQHTAFFQTHEMENDFRGCRAVEVYQNVADSDPTVTGEGQYLDTRMGTALEWGNTLGNTWITNLAMVQDRTDTTHGQTAPPGGWGYCGTTFGPSNWDGNTNSSGYPCLDQVGRGQSDAIAGVFPTKCNTTAGCPSFNGTWPHNKVEPVYEWLDQFVPAPGHSGLNCFSADTSTIIANLDFYCYTLTWNGTAFVGTAFNGTGGTGSGPVASRPATCSPNVAYWETDHSQLDFCYAANTWSTLVSTPPSYVPATYPYPLVGNPAAPPVICIGAICTSGAFTSPQTISMSCPTTGCSVFYTTNGTTPTCSSTAYSSPFSQAIPSTVQAISCATGFSNSSVTTNVYTLFIPSTISTNSVIFSKQITPQPIGNWSGNYGVDGYVFPGITQSLPKYAAVSVSGANSYNWANSTTDGRGLLVGVSRTAPCWYGQQYYLDVNLTDGKTHPFTLYVVDWDSTSRGEIISITDAITGKVMDTRTVSGFNGGTYLQWQVTGHVHVNVNCTAGSNAVVSGLFFN